MSLLPYGKQLHNHNHHGHIEDFVSLSVRLAVVPPREKRVPSITVVSYEITIFFEKTIFVNWWNTDLLFLNPILVATSSLI